MSRGQTSMDAALATHALTSIIGSLSDIAGTIGFCERQVWASSDDHAMRDDTEKHLMGTARVLALAGRLLESEIGEMENLMRLASAQKANNRRVAD